MSIRLLVFAVLVPILGSLSTFGEEGSISNETDPIIVKVKSQSVDVESNSRQSHLNCNEKVKIKKAGKGTYMCTLDIDYSLSPPICLKSTAKWNRPYKKSTTFAIETADAVLTVSVLKNKVKSCKIERLTTATTTSTPTTASSKTTSKTSSERLTTATTTSTPTTPSSKTTSKPSSERLSTATTTSTPTTPSSKTTSKPSSGSYEDAVLEELELSTAFANISLGEEDQHNCKKELKASIKMCQKSEETIAKLRFKKPFVRSTELTDRLGRDSRLYNALKETITRVSSNWTSVEGGESLIEFVSQNFLKWTEKGGGISTLEPKSRSLTRSTKSESKDEDMKCAPFLLVRRIDGKCNNLVNKHQGSAGTALKRFFNNSYEDGSCPARWTSLATGCYKFSGVGNYQEAINNCKNEGGYLIEVDDHEEMKAVKQFYKDEGISVDSVWLGATDEAKEREWIWSHSGKKMNFHAWWGGGAPFGRTHANCLALYASRDFKWYDISCTLTRTALCEFDARQASGSFLTRGGEDESSWIIG